MRIGIPRALLYYQYAPMWQTFFEALGAEVVVSSPTTRAMLATGSSRVVADTCMPVKVFLGHILSLVDKCDIIFIPVVRSVKPNVYNCSKFLGLSDMTRAVIPESPPILDVDIDVNKGKRVLYQSIYELGRHFTWNPSRIKEAGQAAWQAYLDYHELMSRERQSPPEALSHILDGKELPDISSTSKATIAVIGHPYLLYDEYINHRIIHRLRQADNRVVTPEMLTTEEREAAVARLGERAYWTYEGEVVGAGGHYLQSGVDGVIGIMTFGCGPDSLMMDTVRREAARRRATPFMCLTLEEHTAEAGVVTRLEAFVDMIHRRKKGKVTVCA